MNTLSPKTLPTNRPAKKPQKAYSDGNFIESIGSSIGGIGKGVADSFFSDLVKPGSSDINDWLFGDLEQPQTQKSGELSQGEELDLTIKSQIEQRRRLDIAPGIDYHRGIVNTEKRTIREDNQEIKVKINEILIEIKQLVATSKELQVEFKEVLVEQAPKEAGKYHVAFFEWIISLIRIARENVESSQSWLSAMKSKKGKQSYWQMFKKHGTTFGLSNERSVSTQTG